jgi:hypothetical protein
MSQLSDDEFTCLSICGQGESLAAIGRWKPSVESLVAQGLLYCHDVANHVITQAGKKALAERAQEDEKEYRQILDQGRQIQNGRSEVERQVEIAGQALAKAAKAKEVATGITLYEGLRESVGAAYGRAAEILNAS